MIRNKLIINIEITFCIICLFISECKEIYEHIYQREPFLSFLKFEDILVVATGH